MKSFLWSPSLLTAIFNPINWNSPEAAATDTIMLIAMMKIIVVQSM